MQIIPQIDTYFLPVQEQIDKVYQFKPLDGYTFKERVMIRLAGWVFYVLIKLISKTLRFETEGVDWLTDNSRSYDQPIMCVWHDRIFAGMYYLRDRGLVVMSSISFDAEYTARSIQRLGFGVIKGSSTRGGTRALVEMIRLMKHGVPTAFTIDGPRGPRYEAKPGPPLLAKRTGNPMIPLGVEVEKYWTLNSWDKFQIPKPFSRAKMFFGEPIFVNTDADDGQLEAKRMELQNALDDLVERGKEWSASLRAVTD